MVWSLVKQVATKAASSTEWLLMPWALGTEMAWWSKPSDTLGSEWPSRT